MEVFSAIDFITLLDFRTTVSGEINEMVGVVLVI